ncbi:unnamed protein product [Acanthoscelides obtectus]|uniref:DNA mismatch repair protein S5 domain-containing protein n=1 Tax=Acanthoscelides obtectus TaxID=200917 RepID=A0A9P0Q6K5_ACAOB|nr:unnamed protein product [Acanthoscelides obtectus]CAK1638777.1 DNA mismatch repair protein Mlh1 [Acanthoscelides obtectus]
MEVPPIKKLAQDVINRIAAGEVIQRPANALKELIENSIDAKSTNIQITVKNGGLKLLQIQDNGVGIRKEDFEIVCERFTTSKLTEFEDLHKIATYGFRGEALASMSHVAHLTIVSKTKQSMCAYQASYIDSKLMDLPKPVPANQGTTIIVEDLFYNMPVRKKALRSPAEEYQKISDVVSKYAVHNATIGFALKKHSGNNDVRTRQGSNHVENIRTIYGDLIARELIEFSIDNSQFKFKAKGFMTNVNYSTKTFQFLLFINHRLVDCQSLKKSIDHVYETYLPKNAHPFVYMSLELDPGNIDVNISPTKHEVHFLNEQQIVETITSTLETKLLGSNNSRVFFTQAKLPKLYDVEIEAPKEKNVDNNKTINPKEFVRTDFKEQKLDKFFTTSTTKNNSDEKKMNESINAEEFQQCHAEFIARTNKLEDLIVQNSDSNIPVVVRNEDSVADKNKQKAQPVNNGEMEIENMVEDEMPKDTEKSNKKSDIAPLKNIAFLSRVNRVETQLISIIELRKDIEDNCHKGLRETFAQHVYVGAISPSQALIQYSTKLFLCDTRKILAEMFYQYILYNFQNFDTYIFNNKISIYELALMCLDMPESGWTPEDGDKDELARKVSDILVDKSEMLKDYFSLGIDADGNLYSIPVLIDDYVPDPRELPFFVTRVAAEVDWNTEKECFRTFARELASFFANVPKESNQNDKDWKWITEHVIYPAIKQCFIPPKRFINNAAILEIANLPNLYKVFERC